MRIAIIGTGNVGGTLGGRFRAAGHDVIYGSRNPDGAGPGGAPQAAVGEAISGAEVVVLAMPGSAVTDVVQANGAALDGKIVIDAANRMGAPEFNSHAALAEAAPQASYARAFNTLGWENFANPPEGADLFFAADDTARPATEELIRAVGLNPAYVGDASARGTVDGVLALWFALMQQRGGNRRLAFRVLQ
jgi:predicted dinucleotide-binding enzyme